MGVKIKYQIVRDYIKANKFKMEEFANASEVSITTLYKIFRGEPVRYFIALRLAIFMNIDVNELIINN
ncbi:MAG: helix-turn-helix transcriptional regulator [Clostridia bacterium]|nr:helix-turn-helix transcriptional regulator [Clostridia bacterium]